MVKKKTNSRIPQKARAPENRRPGFIIQYPSSLYIHVLSSDDF